ncbi:MAG: hypothetical protein SVS85_01565, partial [Candidatus Nanohaloarchaea archaeon]|nr:hypothetical protein [Candidatus Nanohaloarchaea archaeon]
QSRDDDGNVIGGEMRTLKVDVGREGAVVEPDGGDLQITQVVVPATVMAGQETTMEISVRNTGESDMSGLHVTANAFGMGITEEAGTLEGESTKTVPVSIPVPAAASGREQVRVEVSTLQGKTSINTTITVSDIHATLNLRDETVTVGEHVTVSGIISRRNTRAELFYAGNFLAPVFSDETGHYTHTIIPRRPGLYRVKLSIGSASVEKFLEVNSKLEVREVSAPERISTGSIFNVCGLISRQTEGKVNLELRVDGSVRKSATIAVSGPTERCFPASIPTEGDHTVTISASA